MNRCILTTCRHVEICSYFKRASNNFLLGKQKGIWLWKKQSVERRSAPWRCLCLCLCESFIREAGQRILFDGVQLPAPTSVDRETLGCILDLWVISSTPGTQCNLWKCMAIFVFFFPKAALEPCTMWRKWQCMCEEPTVWLIHQRSSKISISGSRSEIAVILLGFEFVFFFHWARMCVHMTANSVHSSPFHLPQPLKRHKFSSRLYFCAAFGSLSKA